MPSDDYDFLGPDDVKDCPVCDGTGKDDDGERCRCCGGSGFVRKDD